jgi:hypothetical protein
MSAESVALAQQKEARNKRACQLLQLDDSELIRYVWSDAELLLYIRRAAMSSPVQDVRGLIEVTRRCLLQRSIE